jgi:hypothetical protein
LLNRSVSSRIFSKIEDEKSGIAPIFSHFLHYFPHSDPGAASKSSLSQKQPPLLQKTDRKEKQTGRKNKTHKVDRQNAQNAYPTCHQTNPSET